MNIVYKRGYLAIIEGKLKKKHGTIKNHLDESKTQMVYIANNGKGKLAITNYKVLKESRYNSLIEVFLETGRKNQIRVHMQSLGHSIVGDKKYGATTNPIKRWDFIVMYSPLFIRIQKLEWNLKRLYQKNLKKCLNNVLL